MDKKQKLMLGVLAVLILGAGSYWFLMRDSGPQQQAAVQEGPSERVKRQTGRKSDDTKKRARRTKVDSRAEVKSERKEREKSERRTGDRKRRGTSGRKIKKKAKTLPPAA